MQTGRGCVLRGSRRATDATWTPRGRHALPSARAATPSPAPSPARECEVPPRKRPRAWTTTWRVSTTCSDLRPRACIARGQTCEHPWKRHAAGGDGPRVPLLHEAARRPAPLYMQAPNVHALVAMGSNASQVIASASIGDTLRTRTRRALAILPLNADACERRRWAVCVCVRACGLANGRARGRSRSQIKPMTSVCTSAVCG